MDFAQKDHLKKCISFYSSISKLAAAGENAGLSVEEMIHQLNLAKLAGCDRITDMTPISLTDGLTMVRQLLATFETSKTSENVREPFGADSSACPVM